MLLYWSLALLATSALAGPRVPQLDGRIVGGHPTTIDQYPYQLSLQSWGYHICGASIVSTTWAVTAAHCTDGSPAKELSLRSGSSTRGSGGSVHQVAEVLIHPKWNPYIMDYDASLLKVVESFVFDIVRQPIPLASQEPQAGALAVVSGWGTTSSGGWSPTQLQVVEVPIVKHSSCESDYHGNEITNRMICAGEEKGGKDSCQGDSGGPLVCNGSLVGIVSWGIGCAAKNYPGVYANVANLEIQNWLRNTAQL